MQGLFFVLILFSGITISEAFGLEYHDKNYNFTINYPENWNYNDNFITDIALSPVKFFDVTGQGWSAMLQVQLINDQNFNGFEKDKQAFDFLNSYIKRNCNQYTFANDAFICTNLMINHTKTIEQDDKKYYEIYYTWTEYYGELGSNDDTSIVRMIPSDKRAWLLYTETYTKNYENHKSSFYSMMDSFVLPTTELMTNEISTYSLTDINNEESLSNEGGGCIIATAAFGSELAPQVQFLREIRDNTVLSTQSGTSFMTAFNAFYYSFSPTVADWERQNLAFKEIVKVAITPLLSSLSLIQYVDIDSEVEILGYGIGVILLNIGMYFVVPAIFIYKIRVLSHEKIKNTKVNF